ncbi:hypothetical protein ACIBG8_02395 [Nonomuraea sp. NPDC050556]|uniref:hypothetical protein n=1 Tax=Nonomuraea sp. NPDC050556 TaxID=3364369 RepID=UPI0037B4AF51
MIVPLAVFNAAPTFFGLNGALATVLAWVYGNAVRRLLWRKAITARSALALRSGSAVGLPSARARVLIAAHTAAERCAFLVEGRDDRDPQPAHVDEVKLPQDRRP